MVAVFISLGLVAASVYAANNMIKKNGDPNAAGAAGGGGGTSNNNKKGGSWWDGLVSTVQNKQEEVRVNQEAKKEGKIYDKTTRSWKFYYLSEEWEEVLAMEKETEGGGGGAGGAAAAAEDGNGGGTFQDERPVADREYYELLGVSTNADGGAIKKAYYKAARKCHPDKNPDDPEAHSKFQKLGQAYQVLSNEQSRAAYDKNGKLDSQQESMEQMDPFVFFNVMFGSTLIEPYVGELWIAQTGESMMNDQAQGADLMAGLDDVTLTELEKHDIISERLKKIEEKNEVKQRKRQIKCAQNILERIQPYVDAQTSTGSATATTTTNTVDNTTTTTTTAADAFVRSCREEGTKIANGAYGSLYALTMGYAMEVAAEDFLGAHNTLWGLGSVAAKGKKMSSSFGINMKLIGAGIKAATAGSKAMHQAETLQQQAMEKQQQQAGGQQQSSSSVEEENDKTKSETEPPTVGMDETQAAAVMAQTIDDSLPAFLEFTWAINKRDIGGTLSKSCKKLFDDASVSMEVRLMRARGVRILGHEFYLAGKAVEDALPNKKDRFNAEDIKARAAVAAMTSRAKAQGQEMTEEDQEEMIKQAKQMSGGGGGGAETAEGVEEDVPDEI